MPVYAFCSELQNHKRVYCYISSDEEVIVIKHKIFISSN
ncbi:hypothetical protein SALWKB2_1765 [Snodgrassella alvi wkB2]|nr:hypothetical protein SALWKB2_1765 [Snodgrassella alvi wkB2]